MPNWCLNCLEVSVSSADNIHILNNFIEFNNSDESELDFNKLIPIPDELEGTNTNQEKNQDLINKYGYDNWYDWNINNWGTKWNACEVDSNKNNEMEIIYNFQTAWSPPVPWCTTLFDKYPELNIKLEYEEPAMNFGGYLSFENGNFSNAEYELSAHVWENCDKNYIRCIINKYLEMENKYLDDNFDELIDDIIEEIISDGEVNNAYSIDGYLREYILEMLKEDNKEDDIRKLEYENKGNEIKNINL